MVDNNEISVYTDIFYYFEISFQNILKKWKNGGILL